MEHEPIDQALLAANLALTGRRRERTASRFASIQLREWSTSRGTDRHHLMWEAAAVLSVGFAATLFVVGVWFL
jgi:hypothetical protein